MVNRHVSHVLYGIGVVFLKSMRFAILGVPVTKWVVTGSIHCPDFYGHCNARIMLVNKF